MAPYVAEAAIPKVLDFVDSDASKWNQYAERKAWPASSLYGSEGRRLAGFELAMTRSFDASVFVSSREATHLEDPSVREKLHFIQNGVDLEFFRPKQPSPSTATIVFTGAMDYYPNVDGVDYFANKVFPLVRQHADQARFLIVGSRPVRRVQRLAGLTGVEVTGTVPDIRPYLAEAAVAVAPLRIAQGIQNKVLEALAMGIPVVSTSKAAAGIQGLKDLPVTVADEPEGQAHEVLRLLSRGRLSQEEVARTRNCLREHYSWDHNMLAFEDLFEKIAASSPAEVTS
jgi:sugar transferase (PEP-CTERM/EpsH1 system associated)